MAKTCNKCGEDKPESAFYLRKAATSAERSSSRPWTTDILRQPCKACISTYGQQYKQRDAVKARSIQKNSYEKHRTKRLAQGRRAWLWKRYSITPEQYDEMLATQGGVCAICRKAETVTDPRYGQVRSLAVDHCHTTGAVRALLCARCNIGMGLFADSPEHLRQVMEYLERYLGGASDAGTSTEALGPEAAS